MTQKKCSKCNEYFTLVRFRVVNSKNGKLSSMHDECKKEYDRDYYSKNKLKNKDIKNQSCKRNRIKKREFIVSVLKNSNCMDCGIEDWRVLEFDHRERGLKCFNIADSLGFSISKIESEINKCDVVCANCHNIRTIKQRGYYKYI